MSWQPFGALSGLTYGNALVLTRTFTTDYLLNASKVQDTATSTTVLDRSHTFGDGYNLTAITDNLTSARTEGYGYSAANRLNSASGIWGSLAWTYDGVGNRTSEALTSGATTTWSYAYPSTSNKLSTVTQGSNVRTFTHDAMGNVTADDRAGTTYSYRYNNRARLDRLTIGATVTADYTYDGLERLALRTTQNMSPAGTTHYVYDRRGRLIAESDASANTAREYVWLDEMPLAVVADVDTMSPKLWFVHADHLDRPLKMTDAAQATVWDAVFRPFGEVVSITGAGSNNLRFPGQYFLIESGLHYNWHRHYDPTIGRYLQADSLWFVDGPNRYSYVRSSPAGQIDQTGLETVIIINRNTPITGTHAGVATGINRGSSDNQVLYDPGGSYRPRNRGSGDTFTGSEVDLDDYTKFQQQDGPDVERYRFSTTPDEEREISKRIDEMGGKMGGFCAVGVSDALAGIGPFKGLGRYWFPSSLGRGLGSLPGRIQ